MAEWPKYVAPFDTMEDPRGAGDREVWAIIPEDLGRELYEAVQKLREIAIQRLPEGHYEKDFRTRDADAALARYEREVEETDYSIRPEEDWPEYDRRVNEMEPEQLREALKREARLRNAAELKREVG